MKKLNRTKEELDEMNRIRRNRSYEKHKDIECEKSRLRYYNRRKLIGGEIPFTGSLNVNNI
jgi:hypothetical protein